MNLVINQFKNMTLPKVKNKKLIKKQEFIKVARQVQKSLEEEMKYLRERKLKNEDSLPYRIRFHS